jgi:hypothetical protein
VQSPLRDLNLIQSNFQDFKAGQFATITLNRIDGNNTINAANAKAGVTTSGTEIGADNQTVTVQILDDQNNAGHADHDGK